MRQIVFSLVLLLGLTVSVSSQTIREFSRDTGLFVSELTTFTGTSLETSEVPDFQRFIHLYDSLSFEKRLEIIDLSNLMLDRQCRPRPHFITFQRILNEFFFEDKTSHGYEAWLAGFKLLLKGDNALLRTIHQWLSLSLNLLEDNIFYSSSSVTWKVSTPSFQFFTDETMMILFEDVTVACYSGRDFIQIMEATGYINPFTLEWHGIKGKVTWERAGMPDTEMYAILSQFRINLKTPGYVADSVQLYYPALFEGIAIGRLEDKVTLIKDLTSIKYPQLGS